METTRSDLAEQMLDLQPGDNVETPMAAAVKFGRATRDQEVVIEPADGSKRAERELHRLNAELEQRVAERTDDLARANKALVRDMEERRKLEEQLRQAQKMESLGTLAGGIAHDFNNILNIIQGYSALIEMQAAKNDDITDSLHIINNAIKRGAAIVEQLLTLTRKTEAHPEPTDVNGVIRRLVALIKGSFPKNIEVTLDLGGELPLLMADSSQIGQALLNLCVNARDAMPNGGKLTFRTGVTSGTELPILRQRKAERYVCIQVTDDGSGMDESICSRVFEPFFTTKSSKKGTGLGLAIVYGIVKNHEGVIDLESSSGRGATFRLFFPVLAVRDVEDVSRRFSEAALSANSNASYSGVLAVEDEEAVLQLLRNHLTERGFRVMTARDGEAALETYKRHQEQIDVVLLDIDLPKVSGMEVLMKIRAANPNARIVVASGFLEPELKSAIKRAGVTRVIHKPYVLDEILAALTGSEPRGPEERRNDVDVPHAGAGIPQRGFIAP
jgi:signal transduction histidine kinase/CheY-like chemotaxis protein